MSRRRKSVIFRLTFFIWHKKKVCSNSIENIQKKITSFSIRSGLTGNLWVYYWFVNEKYVLNENPKFIASSCVEIEKAA